MDDILFYALAGIGGYMATKRSSTSSSVAAKDVGERAEGHPVAQAAAERDARIIAAKEPPIAAVLGPDKLPMSNSVTPRGVSIAAARTKPLRDRIVQSLLNEESMHIREQPPRDRGPRIDMYQRAVGLTPPSLWCAAFVSWNVMNGMGLTKKPKWASGSTSAMMAKARDAFRKGHLPGDYILFNRDLIRDPSLKSRVQPGWVWIRGSTANKSDPLEAPAGGWKGGHTGIVVATTGKDENHFTTVEGNTWARGGDGQGVYMHKDKKWGDPGHVIFFDPVALSEAYGLAIPGLNA
jgi:hypothetical protein